MNNPQTHGQSQEPGPDDGPNTITPLPGEAGIPNVAMPRRMSVSKKGLLALALLTGGLIAVAAHTLYHVSTSGKKSDEQDPKQLRNRPSAAVSEPRKLDLPFRPTAVASATAASAPVAAAPRIPAIVPTSEELAEPIGVRRTGAGAPTSGGPKGVAPEDAPILLVTTRPGARLQAGAAHQRNERNDQPSAVSSGTAAPELADAGDPMAATTRNLQGYQRQLQGLMDNLTQAATLATGRAATPPPTGALLGGPPSVGAPAALAPPASTGLFGGQLQASSTPKVIATTLGNRSLTLPKGTSFTCALKSRVISATSGLVGCQVQRNVYSDDGRVLLVERGSHLDGEYRITSVRPGTVRIPVLWTRIRTPLGVTVDLDSPATGPLGESGIEGHVDNRWMERIGAAMLLSLIDDSVKLVIQNQSEERGGDTIVLPSTTGSTSKLAEKVLDSTINIPPLIYQNQGGIVGIYVARDVDFSSVYELRPVARDAASEVTQ